jgi:hypothetical protein
VAVARSQGKSALPWGLGLACGAAAAVATPTAVLVAALLGPALLTFMLDPAEGKPVARCVLLCGLSAAAFPLMALWSGGHTMDLSLSLLGDPASVVVAWTVQGAGWLLAELAPLMVLLLQNSHGAARAHRLRTARAHLADEWGLPQEIAPAPAG